MNSEEMVREFHKKHGIPMDTQLRESWQESLQDAFRVTRGLATHLLDEWIKTHDDRLMRAHLICEETSEVLEALLHSSEIFLLDGLADLQYVTVGAAVTFGLPLEAAFTEVHRSNMTKKVTGEHRLRDKGANYSPPDIEGVLRRSR